ncbi:hypothetical protein BB934_30045 (plasmid) [Microvirga ossetica]|uniref:Uncharacterized protein n=1 Tax=Microvirga ossetica TaxID=1882682 RepID=A0A1B2ERC1_9HYPH|nr:hypothetical protein [Microvirga ossetica]ANY82526.1 hypothetical protein BB934_30045 [Microvirga ossetica]
MQGTRNDRAEYGHRVGTEPRPSGRKHARKREADRLGKNLDGIRVMAGLELGKVDRRLAADEDATDETRPVPAIQWPSASTPTTK